LAAELWSDEHQASAGHPWRGRLVAFTGESRFRIRGIQLDREAQQFLATKAGCKTWPRVTKQVEVCIVSDPENETGNLRKAEQYDLELVREADFWAAVGFDLEELETSFGAPRCDSQMRC
jgi:hypothetical protein